MTGVQTCALPIQNVFDGTITYSEKSIIVAQFVKGLLPTLKRLVLSHEPKTLEKAIELAELEESNEKMVHPKEKVHIATLATSDEAQLWEGQINVLVKRIGELESQCKEKVKPKIEFKSDPSGTNALPQWIQNQGASYPSICVEDETAELSACYGNIN